MENKNNHFKDWEERSACYKQMLPLAEQPFERQREALLDWNGIANMTILEKKFSMIFLTMAYRGRMSCQRLSRAFASATPRWPLSRIYAIPYSTCFMLTTSGVKSKWLTSILPR